MFGLLYMNNCILNNWHPEENMLCLLHDHSSELANQPFKEESTWCVHGISTAAFQKKMQRDSLYPMLLVQSKTPQIIPPSWEQTQFSVPSTKALPLLSSNDWSGLMIIVSGQVSEALHPYVLELGYQKNIFNPTGTKLVNIPVLTNDIQK